MELGSGPEEERFRDEVRTFLAEALPADVAERVKRGKAVGKTALNEWTQRLHARGWAAPGWPVEHGGTGWSLVERQIFEYCQGLRELDRQRQHIVAVVVHSICARR